MVAVENRDLVGVCVFIPRSIRARFVHLVRDNGLSARAVIQAFLTQYDAEQAKAFVKARKAAEAAAAQVVKAREGGQAA